MIKKSFLTAVLSLTIAGGAYAAVPAMAQNDEPKSEVTVNAQWEETVVVVDDNQENALPESEIARKMTQAEKAHNAAVNDSWGGAITIIAMCIVILALVVLSLLFLGFGKISQALIARNKRETKVMNAEVNNHEDHHAVDSGDVIAAIAAALSEHFGEGHDMEDTILTIRKLQKAYSPWSSKIYHLRQVPEHRRNIPGQA
ncbi:MAG: OadG family protein [Bacteroides sp.]|nr:OadG family protein [Bacteroides sp.]